MKKKAPKKFTKKNPRKITEPLPRPEKPTKKTQQPPPQESVSEVTSRLRDHLIDYFIIYLAILFAVLLIVLGFVFVMYGKSRDVKLRVEDNYSYWADVVRTHPNVTDAYYNAALYAAQLGNRQKAVEYLNGAIKLDPSFSKAIEFKKRLE